MAFLLVIGMALLLAIVTVPLMLWSQRREAIRVLQECGADINSTGLFPPYWGTILQRGRTYMVAIDPQIGRTEGRCYLSYRMALPFRASIFGRHSWWSGLVNPSCFSVRRSIVLNSPLDSSLRIVTNAEEPVKQWLRDESARKAVLDLLTYMYMIKFDKEGIVAVATTNDLSYAISYLHDLHTIAESLSHISGPR